MTTERILTNYFLKTDSKESLFEALEAAGLTKKETILTGDGPVEITNMVSGVELDIIGVIHENTGEFDEDGLPIFKALEGYHANLLGKFSEETLSLLPTIAAPKTPHRVWA